ncbi:MAG: hypothetical protein WA949_23570 [Phormidesmis sp.]
MTDKKRMGSMSLSSFGKNASVSEEAPPTSTLPEPARKTKAKRKKAEQDRKTATLNIQVTRAQQRWLQNTAQDIRDNNDEPVPGPQRVYPVHLIQAAIDLLKIQDVKWDEIRDVDGLRDALNL